jgi:hypothetical protein
MSRSGYSDDLDPWDLIRWRGAVRRSITGKRGQAFLREMVEALDALPHKQLIQGAFMQSDGRVCALGAVGAGRGMDLIEIDPEDREAVADTFDIAQALVAEIMEENDSWSAETPEHRWARMRAWVAKQLR